MGPIKRFFLKRKIKKASRLTFDNSNMSHAVLSVINIYRSLLDVDRQRVWGLDYHPYSLPGTSLDAITTNTNPHRPDLFMSNPFEWLTGTLQSDMMPYFADPALGDIRDIREMVWHRLFLHNFDHLHTDTLELIGGGLRSILRRWEECL